MVKKKRYKLKKSIILIVTAILLLSIMLISIFFIRSKEEGKSGIELPKLTRKTTTTTTTTTKRLQIMDEDSDTRNVAVMINNIKNVWGYQSGIQDAFLVYEIVAEGGITRFLAVFKDKYDLERIGTVRSARIYYLDYALENDAVYVHIGGSKEALRDIKTLGMIDLQSEVTFRDRSIGLAYEHTAFASMKKIKERMDKRGIRQTTKQDEVLNYSIDEIDLSEKTGAIPANKVYISFSGSKSTTFEYDAENKVYKRFQNDIAHVDYLTKEQYTVKNIITYKVKNHSYDSYGRQALENIGSGEGYYITNGYAVPITWEKSTRSGQTVYKHMDGTEIVVNDGNTHIEIQPKNRKLEIN